MAALADFHGKAVAVTFILSLCTSTCPVPMMSAVQDRLGQGFGRKIGNIWESGSIPSARGFVDLSCACD